MPSSALPPVRNADHHLIQWRGHHCAGSKRRPAGSRTVAHISERDIHSRYSKYGCHRGYNGSECLDAGRERRLGREREINSIHGPRRGRINRRAGIFAARLTFVADNSQLVSVSSSEPYVSWRRLDSASLSHSCENEHRIPGQAGF